MQSPEGPKRLLPRRERRALEREMGKLVKKALRPPQVVYFQLDEPVIGTPPIQLGEIAEKNEGKSLQQIPEGERREVVEISAKMYKNSHPRSKFSVSELVDSVRFTTFPLKNPEETVWGSEHIMGETDPRTGIISINLEAQGFDPKMLRSDPNPVVRAQGAVSMLVDAASHEYYHKEAGVIAGVDKDIDAFLHKGVSMKERRGFRVVIDNSPGRLPFYTRSQVFADLDEITIELLKLIHLRRHGIQGISIYPHVSTRIHDLDHILKRIALSSENLYELHRSGNIAGLARRIAIPVIGIPRTDTEEKLLIQGGLTLLELFQEGDQETIEMLRNVKRRRI